jgi:hypothetical protein
MATSPSIRQPHHAADTANPSTTTQKEFYINILESLIKSFPGPREEAIGKAIAYLQTIDHSHLFDSIINPEPRDAIVSNFSCATLQQSVQVVNEKNHFAKGSAEVDLSQTKRTNPLVIPVSQ